MVVSLINANQDIGSLTDFHLGKPALGFLPEWVGYGRSEHKYAGLSIGGLSSIHPLFPNSTGGYFSGPSYIGSSINYFVSQTKAVVVLKECTDCFPSCYSKLSWGLIKFKFILNIFENS